MFGKKKKYPFNHGKNRPGKVYAGPPLAVYAGPPTDPDAEIDTVNDVYNGPPVETDAMAAGVYAGPPVMAVYAGPEMMSGQPVRPADCVVCAVCGKPNDVSRKFCEICGTPFRQGEA